MSEFAPVRTVSLTGIQSFDPSDYRHRADRYQACKEYAEFMGIKLEELFPEFGPFAIDSEGRYINRLCIPLQDESGKT